MTMFSYYDLVSTTSVEHDDFPIYTIDSDAAWERWRSVTGANVGESIPGLLNRLSEANRPIEDLPIPPDLWMDDFDGHARWSLMIDDCIRQRAELQLAAYM
jgi:hypothetical protein